MQLYYLIVLTCLLGVAASENTKIQPSVENDILTVTLFYESYCPGCIAYLGTNLMDAWNIFKTNISIDLVPYGFVRTQYDYYGHLEYYCQHGPKECLGNKLHACAILQACGQGGTVSCKSADKLDHVIRFIHCLEQQPDQMEATADCAKIFDLDANDIKYCAQSPKGDRLFNFYGRRTMNFRPVHVPSVAINGKYYPAARENLVREICRLRPRLSVQCSQMNINTK